MACKAQQSTQSHPRLLRACKSPGHYRHILTVERISNGEHKQPWDSTVQCILSLEEIRQDGR